MLRKTVGGLASTALVVGLTTAGIVVAAPAYLVPGGWLLLEHGYDQAAAVRDLLTAGGFVEVASACDLAGIERITLGRRP